MQQTLQLNIIPFTAPLQEAEFAFYTTKHEGYCPIHKDDLNGAIEGIIDESELHYGNWLYTDFLPAKEDAIVITVNLTDCKYFAQHYYRHIIRNHFKGVADIMRKNFTNEIEVWFHNTKSTSTKFKVYNQFTLKVQHSRITDSPELVLSYDGTTKVYNKSIAEIQNFQTENYNWINCNGELNRWKYLTDEQKLNHEKNYPVVSNKLKPHFDIAFDIPDFKNRYPKYFNNLKEFYDKYLNTEVFRAILPLAAEGFYKPNGLSVQRINGTSNELQFGNGVGIEPKKDLRRLKPYKPVPPPNNVKFFFIYHKPDRELAVTEIYKIFKDGYNGKYPFPRMEEFISQPFEIEKETSISFDTIDEAVSVVQKAIKNKDKLPDTKYFAIYISPIAKWDKDPKRLSIYHRIKEILLYEGISSQVIYKDNIFKEAFNLFLPNIETAILAKLGGVPWRLKRDTTNELIVGVGAFNSITRKTKYVGSAFCFNNEGIFKGFDCFGAMDTDSLAGSIREAVGKFIASNYKATRLIIHFYKDLSKKELKPIIDTLHALGLPIPVIVVTINKTESKELLAFDTDNEKLMPYSGTIVKVASKEYLLFNNTRYEATSAPTDREHHFPVKISFFSSQAELVEDPATINQLIDQVYQFSRMYWKSVSQQNLPVTIKYPEMVAEIFPYFSQNKLPDFGKESLWFL
ncbi:MAG: Piwi domain-containing protein [Sediminibacterium sp.]|uniref:Piwi domain-containing protein n=1 Tax=Sediminibacterium sp. TaxID=1917865 RepID=UPI0027165654|nr:Piwi domain-containing protein [Sediminibacterium sp.]MDO8996354.1 Piwi domain-containing protein [Sediminibacterium sp.]